MKKIGIYVFAIVLFASINGFTTINDLAISSVSVKKTPRGYFIGNFSIGSGDYQGTYAAYADENDHNILIYVIGSTVGKQYVTGEYAGSGNWAFTFNNDLNQDIYTFSL